MTFHFDAQYSVQVEGNDYDDAYNKARALVENADTGDFALGAEKETSCEQIN